MERVIIIGGSEGLWLALSKQYLRGGGEVICISRKKPDIDVIHLPTDLTDKESIEKTIQTIQEDYSEFLTLISCAGIGYIENIQHMDRDHTKQTFDVNVIGQSLLLWGIIENIKNNNADVIFVGATIGYKGNEFMPMYSVSKRWTRGLIENIRLSLKNSSCRVIGVSPWWMNTESNIGLEGRETHISEITGNPIGKLLDVNKVAEFIFSLTQLPKNMEISEVIINNKKT